MPKILFPAQVGEAPLKPVFVAKYARKPFLYFAGDNLVLKKLSQYIKNTRNMNLPAEQLYRDSK